MMSRDVDSSVSRYIDIHFAHYVQCRIVYAQLDFYGTLSLFFFRLFFIDTAEEGDLPLHK